MAHINGGHTKKQHIPFAHKTDMNPFALLGELSDNEDKNAVDVRNPRQQCPVVLIGSIAAFMHTNEIIKLNATCHAWCDALAMCPQNLNLHANIGRLTQSQSRCAFACTTPSFNLRRHVTSLNLRTDLLSTSETVHLLGSWEHLKCLTCVLDVDMVSGMNTSFQFPTKLTYLDIHMSNAWQHKKCIAPVITNSLRALSHLNTFVVNELCSCESNVSHLMQMLAVLPPLAAIELKMVNLFNKDDIMQFKKHLNTLRVLDVRFSSNALLQELCAMPHRLLGLKEINMSEQNIDRETMEGLTNLPALVKLHPAYIHPNAFEALGGCSQLRELHISFYPTTISASECAINTLATSLKRLTLLKVVKLSNFTSRQVNILFPCLFASLPHVEELNLRKLLVSDFSIFAPLQKLKRLYVETTISSTNSCYTGMFMELYQDYFMRSVNEKVTKQLLCGMYALSNLTNPELEKLVLEYDVAPILPSKYVLCDKLQILQYSNKPIPSGYAIRYAAFTKTRAVWSFRPHAMQRR